MVGMTISEMLEAAKSKAESGQWYPANGGTETAFVTRSGRRLLYCWQPTTGNHAYLDCDTDIFLDNEEAEWVLAK
jgi:hypothetical protein